MDSKVDDAAGDQAADWEEQQEMEDKKMIDEYVAEINGKSAHKQKMRQKNLNVEEFRPDESVFFRLDSSLKKNTAFVRKLKTYSDSQREPLLKDIKSLNLTKYISEVAAAIVDTKLKMSDIPAMVEICCLLHERYADFSETLLDVWKKVLLQPKDNKEDKKITISNQSKFRVDLRFFAELVSVAVLPEKLGERMLGVQLNILINCDNDEHNNISIIQSFCKHCGMDYAGLVPRKYQLMLDKFNLTVTPFTTLPPDKQRIVRNLLKDYYTSISEQLLKNHQQLRQTEYQNKRILHTKGELSQEKQDKYDNMIAAYHKLVSNVQTLSDLVGEEMIKLPVHKFGNDDDMDFNSSAEFQYDGDKSLYEDEETAQFYEKLMDLRSLLPQIMLKDQPLPQTSTSTQDKTTDASDEIKLEDVEREMEEESEAEKAESEAQEDPGEKVETEEHVDETAESHTERDGSIELATTSKLLFEKFVADLPKCINREHIDRAAQDFCLTHNTKRHRKKLVAELFHVPRVRLDLLPFYGRFVATLNQCMPDIAEELCAQLAGDFRFLFRKKDPTKIESKVKNVRYIGELTKFKVFKKADTLKCLRTLLAQFKHHDIDMACALLETCGRFLYRSPDSHDMTRIYLEMMLKKKAAVSLDQRYNTMIENAFYTTNPPTTENIVREQIPPINMYIKKLLYRDLNKYNVEKILRQMRKLPWKDEDIRSYSIRALTAVWNVKYACIPSLANLVAGLTMYYDDIGIQIVDSVLEDTRVGMEINVPKFNQRRLAMVRYLGELYNFKMADSTVIVKTLYSFITFGVTYELDVHTELDTPAHLFRLRLVCTLLDTCGSYFDRGSHKKKLDYFLIYFQKYFWYKKALPYWSEEFPFPPGVDTMVRETLDNLRPKTKYSESYLEAVKECDILNEQLLEKLGPLAEQMSFSQTDMDEGLEDLGDGNLGTITEELEDEEMSQTSLTRAHEQDYSVMPHSQYSEGPRSNTPSDDDDDDDDDDDIGLTQDSEDVENQPPDSPAAVIDPHIAPRHVQCQEDEDFMAEFDKMLLENITSRAQEQIKVAQSEITVPANFRQQVKKPFIPMKGSMMEDTNPDEHSPTKPHKFALMVRKGNKPTFTALNLDVSQQFAFKYKERELKEKAEKEQMKQLVLEINERQEEEEQAAIEAGKSLLPGNTNREKKIKYQHPKGAPDADLIFGSGPKNPTKR